MTKNFSYRVYQLIGLPFMILFFFSCKKTDVISDTPAGVQEVSAAKTTGGKPNTVAVMNLSVTVSDATGNKITSDAKGGYVNGSQNVSAYFDQYGNLQFDTNPAINNKNKPTAIRYLNFSFDSPADGTSPTSPAMANIITNPKGDYRMVSQNDGQTPAQSMDVGASASETIRLGGGFADGSSTDWNFSFEYNNVTNTSFATLTRVDANNWTITGAANPPVGRIISNGSVVGFYYLPYTLTLTKL